LPNYSIKILSNYPIKIWPNRPNYPNHPIQIYEKKGIIANLDDIINYHHNTNIIGLMTHILPLFAHYNKIEFVISYNKINNLLLTTYKDNRDELKTYIIINLGILAKKTNTKITIIYSKFSTTAIDYYMLLNSNSSIKMDILKKDPISLSLQSAIPRINVMKFNKNDISYHSINVKPIEKHANHSIIPITEFFN
jgi:hypothetical protein